MESLVDLALRLVTVAGHVTRRQHPQDGHAIAPLFSKKRMDRLALDLARNVVQGHIDGRFGAGIAVDPGFHLFEIADQVGRVSADQKRRQILDRGAHALHGLAGQDGRGRRLAPTDGPVRRFDPDDDIVRRRELDTRHLDRVFQWQRDTDGFNTLYLHRSTRFSAIIGRFREWFSLATTQYVQAKPRSKQFIAGYPRQSRGPS